MHGAFMFSAGVPLSFGSTHAGDRAATTLPLQAVNRDQGAFAMITIDPKSRGKSGL